MDIRVGKLLEVWKHPESENLYCEKIDIGSEVRQIASGVQKFIPIEEMKGLVCVLANLKPRKLAEFVSNGMILCASNADKSKIEILRPPENAKVGDRIVLKDFESLFAKEEQPQMNPKKKVLEYCLPLCKTDDHHTALFNGKPWILESGEEIKCQTITGGSID